MERVESRMSEERRRRRRRIKAVGERVEQKPILLEERESESTANDEIEQELAINLASKTEVREEQDPFTSRNGMNEIRSELMEERYSALVESGYWDETHSWGVDDEEASDEYWHFLGRYE